MLQKLQSKRIAVVIMCLVLVSIIGLGFLAAYSFVNFSLAERMSVCIDGEFSMDGGEWTPFDNLEEINVPFKKAVFKGKISPDVLWMNYVTFSTKNVWFTLKKADGELLAEYTPVDLEGDYKYYTDTMADEMPDIEPIDYEEYKRLYYEKSFFQVTLSDTPGYAVSEFYLGTGEFASLTEDDEVILEVEYPYDNPRAVFSDCFSCLVSEANGTYTQFFYSMPLVILFVLICFFGLFFFPVAGSILGKIDFSYLAFGVLCFCWGVFMLVGIVSNFMNLWILDPTICLVIERLCSYFLIISILFYLKSNLRDPVSRAVANCTGVFYFILIVTATVLHFCNVIDMYASSPYMFIATAVCALIMAVLLIMEISYNRLAFGLLISWIPLSVSIIIDAINHFVHFTSIDFYYFGLAVTMIYQIVRSFIRLREQYTAAIRYQQIQKELYEAKVNVMVSQIQPHFMYNTLSSIAMLCKLDPDTAYQATITFSQYLRSNMDSLKQTKPIPFEQELEHLKKYLYIEKLRFGKKLNIEYDIQATDFELPQLSIQPLAENAVKHGISKKRGGGTLTISTRETDDAYEVIVADDGVGFDTSAPVPQDDGRSHVGMENIKRRLKEMCDAEVVIESEVGKGTTARVIIPKKQVKEEDTES